MKNNRKQAFANVFHRQIFLLVFLGATIPAFITAVCLYYFIFSIVADQIGFPEAIAYNVIPAARRVVAILICTAPLAIGIILYAAFKISHRIVGPFDRIVRELDQTLSGQRQGPIKLREGDRFQPLVERINRLLG